MCQWQSFLHRGHSEYPVFHNINLRTPSSFGMLFTCCSDEVSDKFTSLQQVNSPNSQDKFQICCTDTLLVQFLITCNFTVFCMFLWISWDFADLLEIRGSATMQNIRSPVIRGYMYIPLGQKYRWWLNHSFNNILKCLWSKK